MTNPPFIISQIKWRFDIATWLKEKHNLQDEIIIKYKSGRSGLAHKGSLFHIGITYPMPHEVIEQVIAIADCPDFDPAVTEFDFCTAVELMNAGYKCLSCLDKEWEIDVDGYPHNTNAEDGWACNDDADWDEILGKWRLA